MSRDRPQAAAERSEDRVRTGAKPEALDIGTQCAMRRTRGGSESRFPSGAQRKRCARKPPAHAAAGGCAPIHFCKAEALQTFFNAAARQRAASLQSPKQKQTGGASSTKACVRDTEGGQRPFRRNERQRTWSSPNGEAGDAQLQSQHRHVRTEESHINLHVAIVLIHQREYQRDHIHQAQVFFPSRTQRA